MAKITERIKLDVIMEVKKVIHNEDKSKTIITVNNFGIFDDVKNNQGTESVEVETIVKDCDFE